MKRYLVFGGESYYARGGWNDFLVSFDELHQAKSFISAWKAEDRRTHEWAHIIDSHNWGIVIRTEEIPYGDPTQ